MMGIVLYLRQSRYSTSGSVCMYSVVMNETGTVLRKAVLSYTSQIRQTSINRSLPGYQIDSKGNSCFEILGDPRSEGMKGNDGAMGFLLNTEDGSLQRHRFDNEERLEGLPARA